MSIKELSLYVITLGCFSSCLSTKQMGESLEGTFTQKDNENIKLILLKNQFYLTDPYKSDLSLYQCCDTITYGQWAREGQFIVLETPQLYIDSLPLKVQETSNLTSDSLYIYITNPIEQYHEDYRLENNRSIKYNVIVKSKNVTSFTRNIGKDYRTNKISIPKPKNILIESITIMISPTEYFRGRNIGIKKAWTECYTVKSELSNVFKIEIPQVTLAYFTLLRLRRDFIKIIDKNNLEWDGEIYVRQ